MNDDGDIVQEVYYEDEGPSAARPRMERGLLHGGKRNKRAARTPMNGTTSFSPSGTYSKVKSDSNKRPSEIKEGSYLHHLNRCMILAALNSHQIEPSDVIDVLCYYEKQCDPSSNIDALDLLKLDGPDCEKMAISFLDARDSLGAGICRLSQHMRKVSYPEDKLRKTVIRRMKRARKRMERLLQS